MHNLEDATLLRIFVGEDDECEGHPLYEVIVARAMKNRMAGATVLRCPEGFGHSRYIRSELYIDAGPRCPIVVEIVDREDRIEQFLPVINELIESGLVTMERVRAIRYARSHVSGPIPSGGSPNAVCRSWA